MEICVPLLSSLNGLLPTVRYSTSFLPTTARAFTRPLPTGSTANPDPVARRQMVKAAERARSAAQIERDNAALHETGIRTLRRKPIFTTPNFFPPEGNFRAARGIPRTAALLRLQEEIFPEIHPFLRPAMPRVRRL